MANGLTLKQAFQLWLYSKASGTSQGGAPPFLGRMLSGVPHWREWSTRRAVKEGYGSNTWVYACVRRLASATAGIPWIAEVKDKDGKWQREQGHPIEVLLRAPNPFMSGQDLMEQLSMALDLGGNGIWYLNIVRNAPVELWPLPSDRVTPVPDRSDWISKYLYKPEGSESAIPYEPTQILHYMFQNPGDPYWGIAPLQAAAKVVDSDVEAVAWNKISLQNRAITDGVFSFEHVLDQDQFDEARREVREQYQGKENAHMPWVLGGGAKWNPMARSPVEMDFIESRKMNREEICAVFQVPPPLVGILDHGNYANYEQAVKQFWQDTMIPRLRDISAALNLGLVPFFDPKAALRAKGQLVEPDLRVKPDLSGVNVLQEDLSQLVNTGKTLFTMGVPFSQINQRLDLGFEEFDGWDEPWRPATIAPADGNGGLVEPAQPAPAKSSHRSVRETKMFNLKTADEKKAHWQSIENQRDGWYGNVTEYAKSIFEAERKGIGKILNSAQSESEKMTDIDNLITKNRETWAKFLAQTYVAVAKDFGDRTFRELKASAGPSDTKEASDGQDAGEFNVFDNAVQNYITNHASAKVKQITDTTQEQIKSELNDGVQNGEGIPQLAKRIDKLYLDQIIPNRSTVIARTEVINASNMGSHMAAQATGLPLEKEWLATPDDRTRETHALASGQTQDMKSPFIVGGEELMWPGDTSLGATADEIVQCRCTQVYATKGGN